MNPLSRRVQPANDFSPSDTETEFKFDHNIRFLFSKGQAPKLNEVKTWTNAPI